jgi:hypothetical protein
MYAPKYITSDENLDTSKYKLGQFDIIQKTFSIQGENATVPPPGDSDAGQGFWAKTVGNGGAEILFNGVKVTYCKDNVAAIELIILLHYLSDIT